MWGGFWAQNFNTVSPLGKLRQFKWDKCYVAKKSKILKFVHYSGKIVQIMANHGKAWQIMANHGK